MKILTIGRREWIIEVDDLKNKDNLKNNYFLTVLKSVQGFCRIWGNIVGQQERRDESHKGIN